MVMLERQSDELSTSESMPSLSTAAESVLTLLQGLLNLTPGDRPEIIAALQRSLPEKDPVRQELTAFLSEVDEAIATSSVSFNTPWI